MAKYGINHDYDLNANLEKSAQKKDFVCAICETENPGFKWTDRSGEAVCLNCHTPYQLKWGTEQMEEDKNYPYILLKEKYIGPIKQYFSETGQKIGGGTYLGKPREHREEEAKLVGWLDENHPELKEKK